VTGVDALTPVVVALLASLQDAVADLDRPPAKVGLRPGVTADLLISMTEDECCAGLAWVRVASVYPSGSFPQPDADYVACAPLQYAAVLELGIARCAPVGDAQTLPSADDWNDATGDMLADAAALRRTVCTWVESNPDRMYLVGVWQPLPVEGGCLGGVQTVTVAIDACDCLDD
jgi:hypothetical protein